MRSIVAALGVVLILVWMHGARAAPPAACGGALSKRIPPRPAGAMSGSAFARHISGMGETQRERAIRAQLLAGNIPDLLRRLRPVRLSSRRPTGEPVTATLCVMPDYLAIGSDEDHLRIPANLYTATAVADAFGFVLPTKTMVDAIYRQATYRLRPQPMPPGPRMRSTAYYLAHNRMIEHQLPAAYAGELVAGDKKDVILSDRLATRPGRIAIYGWHRSDGNPIQPRSTVHGARYADYSHGIRLVSDTVWIDGRAASVYAVLADPVLAGVLSDEGPLTGARALMAAAAEPATTRRV